jgi:hypothetical protein
VHVVSSGGVLAIITCALYNSSSNPSTTFLSLRASLLPALFIDKESLHSLICVSEYSNSTLMMNLIYLLCFILSARLPISLFKLIWQTFCIECSVKVHSGDHVRLVIRAAGRANALM